MTSVNSGRSSRIHHASPSLYETTIYTVSQKKQYTGLLIITSADVDQFTQFFHWQIPKKILYTRCKDTPPHLKYVSTLPCETWQLLLLPISMAYIARASSELIMQGMRPL